MGDWDVARPSLRRISTPRVSSLVAPGTQVLPVTFHDLFEIEKFLGSGSFGKVELVCAKRNADNIEQDTLYAVKIFDNRVRDLYEEQSLYKERDIMQSLHHPGIVRFITSLQWVSRGEVQRAIVTEFCPGGSLQQKVEKEGLPGLPMQRVVRYAREMLHALRYLHHAGVLHRDLSPDNVLLTHDDHCKLADFGFAKRALLADTGLVGKINFMAPEVLQSSQSYGPAADTFSFGAVVLFIACGYEDTAILPSCTPRNFAQMCEDAMNPDPEMRAPVDKLLDMPCFRSW